MPIVTMRHPCLIQCKHGDTCVYHDDDDDTSEHEDSDTGTEDESSITAEKSSEEEINPWTTLINYDAASKIRTVRRHLASASHGG